MTTTEKSRSDATGITLDSYDRQILEILQEDGRISNARLAETLGLSISPCWRRVRRLERAGIIRGYRALLAPEKVGLPLIAFVHISVENHSSDIAERLDRVVQSCREVQECHSMSGQDDYLLKVVSASMAAFEHFLSEKLMPVKGLRTIHTSFVLRSKKHTTVLPLPQAR